MVKCMHFSLSVFYDLILCTKYFRSCILWPYKILSLLQLVSVPGDGAEGSAL